MHSVFIAHVDDDFKEHLTTDGGSTTICGLRYEESPDVRPDWPGDKPWYFDHDKDDVVACSKCMEIFSNVR